MEKSEVTVKYGDPRYIFELGWHDEAKKDYLIVKDYKLKSEVMNARAKGVTIYELIDIYGGVDNVSEAFSKKENEALYADVSQFPEMASDDSYLAFEAQLKGLQAKLDELKKPTPTEEKADQVEKGGAEEK